MASRPRGSRPAVGSSRIRTLGSMAMTPAMATRRFWPPDRSKGDLSSWSSVKPTRAADSRTRRSISSLERPMLPGPKAISLYTVSSNSWYSGYWNTRPTWKRTCRIFLGSAQMSFPSSRMRPWVGRSSPLRCWIRVDLPEPVWPMMPRNSPGMISRLTSSTALRWNGVPAL